MILPPALFLLSVVAMALLHWLAPFTRVLAFPMNLVGLGPLATGVAAATWGSRRFRLAGTEIKTFGTPSQLVTDGLFRLTRNPMYLGFVTALVGIWILLGSLSPGIAVLIFVAITHGTYIPYEEHAMRERFGPAYEAYCATTNRWL